MPAPETNTYLESFHAGGHSRYSDCSNSYANRRSLVERFAWAVPTPAAIKTLVDLSPVVEIGAGTGYWAYLVRKAGGEILAFDSDPPLSSSQNSYRHRVQYTEVLLGGPEVLKTMPPRFQTLFLCWPPYSDSFAYDCLVTFKGKNVVYIGEGEFGCNATDSFFRQLRRHWIDVREIVLPQFYGIHDRMRVLRRKGRS
jgi:hypothetical protein